MRISSGSPLEGTDGEGEDRSEDAEAEHGSEERFVVGAAR